MKKFIDLIIKLLIYMVITAVLIIIGIGACFIYFSKSNDIEIEDSLTYLTSFTGNQIPSFSLTNKDSINLSIYEENKDKSKTISNNIFSNLYRYYYSKLTDNASKVIYSTLENNIDNLKKENYTMNFSTKFNNILNQKNGQDNLNSSFQTALDAFFYDHPELFYIDLTKISLFIKSTTLGSKTTYTVSIAPINNTNYLKDNFKNENQVDMAILEVENIRNNLIQKIDKTKSDYDKAILVHDTLVNSLDYDSSLSNNNTYNIYGALVEKSVVCEGYAKSFKYILDSLDIKCILVSGTATNSSGETENHMWNYINLNENWYGVDVTWDDPIILGGGITKNIIRHNYFAKGSTIFNKTHLVSRKISETGYAFNIPILNTENFN